MLKRNLFFIIAIGMTFVFMTNAFGQNNRKNSRTIKKTTQATGGTIPVYWNRNSAGKRRKASVNHSFHPTTQPFADGLKKRKSKPRNTHNLLPYIEQSGLRKKGKYANQEVSYRKNKSSNRRKAKHVWDDTDIVHRQSGKGKATHD